MQLKKSRGFPIAVSMKTVAASGGYYVSAGADQISPSRPRSPAASE